MSSHPPLLAFFSRSRCALWSALLLLFLLPWGCADQGGRQAPPDFASCADCHAATPAASTNGEPPAPVISPSPAVPEHDLPCGRCHLPPELRDSPLDSHAAIIAHPATLANAPTLCGDCHDAEIRALSRSLHGTMAGIINQTRYLWGAQSSALPPVYGVASPRNEDGGLAPLPKVSNKALLDPSPEVLVDDFLRRRCLRCHIDAAPPPLQDNSSALQRGLGCAACHDLHAANSSPIPDARCLTCHNNNHGGADAHGLFLRDTDDWFQKAVIQGRQVPAPYGGAQLRLAPGLHTRRGLWCVDCHGKRDVMGDDVAPPQGFALQRPDVSCAGCHGGWGSALAPEKRLRQQGDKLVLSSASGREHVVPPFRATTAAHHDVRAHGSLRCDACHGLWSYQDYGLEAVYQEGGEYDVWRYLTRQGDPFVENALLRVLENPARTPRSPDHLSGEERPGLWLVGYRFRRWSPMPLGRDHQGRVAVLRPRHQYRVSAVDQRGVCVLDGAIPQRGDGSGRGWAFMPQALHSIAKQGRPCSACHGNAEAAGLGSDLSALATLPGTAAASSEFPEKKRVRDLALTTPQPPAVDSMRLLDMSEAEALLLPSPEVRRRVFAARRAWLEPFGEENPSLEKNPPKDGQP